MSAIFTDGNFSTPDRVNTAKHWFKDKEAKSKGFRITVHQIPTHAPDFAAFSDSISVNSVAYYCGEVGEARHIGGGIQEWTESYFAVPEEHDEFELFNYAYLGFANEIHAIIDFVPPFVLSVASRLNYVYAYSTTPYATFNAAGEIWTAFSDRRGLQFSEALALLEEDELVAESTGIERWHGNIWRARTRWVPTFQNLP